LVVNILVKVVVLVYKLCGKHVGAVATRCGCGHGHGVVSKHVVVHGVLVEVACCVVEEHVGVYGVGVRVGKWVQKVKRRVFPQRASLYTKGWRVKTEQKKKADGVDWVSEDG
jgi:hypothetical protein